MRGYITRGRVDSTWYLRAELPRLADGKRQQRRETVRGTKAEAQKHLRQILTDPERGVLGSVQATVAQLCEQWLASKRHGIEARTLERYEAQVRLHVVPALGSIRLDSVKLAHVRKALDGWMTLPSHNKAKPGQQPQPLSPVSVGHILATTRMIFRQAVNHGLLVRNSAINVEMPPRQHREIKTLDAAGIAQLLRAAEGTDLQAPIALMTATGLRRGEALGLRWSDVDLEAGRLEVRRSLETVDGEQRYKAPKTARSARTVSLAAFAVDVLRRHRAAQASTRLMLGMGRESDGPVFSTVDGKPLDPKAFSKRFARLAERAKIGIRLHDLRHTYGTLALAAGVDLKTLSSSMGHWTITLTANTYLHASDSLQRDSAARIDAILGAGVADAMMGSGERVSEGSVPQRCQTGIDAKKKARGDGLLMVAGTGFESVRRGVWAVASGHSKGFSPRFEPNSVAGGHAKARSGANEWQMRANALS